MVMPAALYLIALLFSGFLAGLFGLGTVVIQPVSLALPADAHVLFRQRMTRRLHYLAPPILLCALFSNLLLGIFFTSGSSRALLLLTVAMYCASIGTTLFGNVPLNHRFMEWKLEALPDNWTELVRRWGVYDRIRFCLCLLAFLFALAAAGQSGLR